MGRRRVGSPPGGGRTSPEPSPLRVVVDTNVLIASFFGKGSADLLRAWREGEVVLCVSGPVLAEYRGVLGGLRFLGKRREELLEALEAGEGVVRVRARRRLREVPDPGDNRLLECALAAGARFLITSDQALLALDGFRGLEVCTPASFWRRWSAGLPSGEGRGEKG